MSFISELLGIINSFLDVIRRLSSINLTLGDSSENLSISFIRTTAASISLTKFFTTSGPNLIVSIALL